MKGINSKHYSDKLSLSQQGLRRFINENKRTRLLNQQLLELQKAVSNDEIDLCVKIQTELNNRKYSCMKVWIVKLNFDDGEVFKTAVYATDHMSAYKLAIKKAARTIRVVSSIIEISK